jgi:hypothetical protein
MGVLGFDSTRMEGTAATLLPGHPDAGLMYAVAFARDCSSVAVPSCVDVPSDGCPLLPSGADANLVFRAYLEPSTMTGPERSEIVVDRVLHVE